MNPLFMVEGIDNVGRVVSVAWAFSAAGARRQSEWLKHPDREYPAQTCRVTKTHQHEQVQVIRNRA